MIPKVIPLLFYYFKGGVCDVRWSSGRHVSYVKHYVWTLIEVLKQHNKCLLCVLARLV